MNKKISLLACTLVFSLSATLAHAQPLQPTDLARTEPTQQTGLPAITVFVSRAGNSQDDSAAQITAMHEKMGSQGWTVIDVEAYDKRGFFITYVQHKQKWSATD